MFKVKGNVKKVGQTVSVSEKFSKRELVLEIPDDKYPQIVSFEATQDKCAIFDSIMEGQEVEISFGLKGREWKNPQGEVKVFNTLNAFRVDAVGSAPAKPTPAPVVVAEDGEDLPF